MRRYIFGEWKSNSDTPISVTEAHQICDAANVVGDRFVDVPLSVIYQILDKVREYWRQSNYHLRVEAQEFLPSRTGFSPEMIKLGLDEIYNMLDPENLQKKVETELRGIPRGVEFKYDQKTATLYRWYPIGSVLHVLSGNVFLVGPGSLLEGLLTGNVSILKMPSAEMTFMPLFIKSLEEAEIELGREGMVSQSIALVDYSSHQLDVIETFKNRVDGIVVWGGESAVAAYRNNLPAKTRFIVFGPKLSMAIISRQGLQKSDSYSCYAKKLAQEMALWDQNACTAPQVCFVEGSTAAREFAVSLSKELESMATELPAGRVDRDTAADIRKLRSIFEIAQARDQGVLLGSKNNLDWTVIVDENSEITPSPLSRTIRVIPFEKINMVTDQIAVMRSYIQTVGLAVSPLEALDLGNQLGKLGVLKVVDLGSMSGGEIDDPHDGAYDLPQLMNLVVMRCNLGKKGMRPIDLLAENKRDELKNALLLKMISQAKKSKFYADRLQNIKIDSVSDLEKVAILSPTEWGRHMPPNHQELQTTELCGGEVTRSGGSTGDPKFSWFDNADWQAMVDNAAEVFISIGLNSQDRMANCFISGDLYGSFISFNDVNQKIGLTSFPFGGVVSAESLIDVWRRFKFNAFQGVPSSFMPILRAAKEIEPKFIIEKVIYAGQLMSSVDRNWLKDNLETSIISSVIGTTEAGQMAYQCQYCEGNVHHLIEDYNHIEIVDEQGLPVVAGTAGRILVTALQKMGLPVIRYDIGDAGSLLKDDSTACPCGRVSRRIEYLGRHDDVISIGLMNLSFSDIAKALNKFDVSELQIMGATKNSIDHIVINIETNSSLTENEVIKELSLSLNEFAAHYKKELFSIEVNIKVPGSLERNKRSGKLKNVIDLRK